jgi:alkylation response protein AidB-like acyl-CoA dehydrogenase
MISGWTEEHEELRDVVRRFLGDKSSSEQVRRLIDEGRHRDDQVWDQMASQLGLHGVAIAEEYGGAGLGSVELNVVMEEMGRCLLVAPFFSTVILAGQLLSACDDESARARWLPLIADGTLTATVAVADATGSMDADAVTSTAIRASEGWEVSGTKMFVVDGTTADLVLVAARVDDEVALFAVEAGAAGLDRQSLPQLDLTRPLARIELKGARATRIEGDAVATLDRVGDLVLSALAAEQIGGASAALDMAVEYAKIRVQFGRPIGSFQAIKHRCADLLVEVESGRSAAFFAAAMLEEGDPEAALAASLAKAWCSTAYTHAAKENIQIHGGIGYTWEHDAHLHLRRAKASDLLFGSPRQHRARVADLAGIGGKA